MKILDFFITGAQVLWYMFWDGLDDTPKVSQVQQAQYNSVYNSTGRQIKSKQKELSDMDLRILVYINQVQGTSVLGLEKVAGISNSQARYKLNKLVEKGYLVKEKRKANIIYILSKKGRNALW